MTTGIDRTIDRLLHAHVQARLPRTRRPRVRAVDRTLAEVAAAVAPLALPAEVERFWRRVDPASLLPAPGPRLLDPAAALHGWHHHAARPGTLPRLLLPIARAEERLLLVELHDEARQGGALFEWAAGDGFVLRFPSLTAYLDLLATMLELGALERRGRTVVGVVPQEWDDAQVVRLAAALPHPLHGEQRAFGADPAGWPARWRAAGPPVPSAPQPSEATTISRLLAAEEVTRGTIRARITYLAGSADGARATCEDGTGVLDVWCPTTVSALGPVIGERFELDVVVTPGRTPSVDAAPDHREAQRRALDDDLPGAQDAIKRIYDRYCVPPAMAEAEAIRPLV